MTIELLDAGEEKVCIDFTKNEGDAITFYEEFNTIKAYLGETIDATYETS